MLKPSGSNLELDIKNSKQISILFYSIFFDRLNKLVNTKNFSYDFNLFFVNKSSIVDFVDMIIVRMSKILNVSLDVVIDLLVSNGVELTKIIDDFDMIVKGQKSVLNSTLFRGNNLFAYVCRQYSIEIMGVLNLDLESPEVHNEICGVIAQAQNQLHSKNDGQSQRPIELHMLLKIFIIRVRDNLYIKYGADESRRERIMQEMKLLANSSKGTDRKQVKSVLDRGAQIQQFYPDILAEYINFVSMYGYKKGNLKDAFNKILSKNGIPVKSGFVTVGGRRKAIKDEEYERFQFYINNEVMLYILMKENGDIISARDQNPEVEKLMEELGILSKGKQLLVPSVFDIIVKVLKKFFALNSDFNFSNYSFKRKGSAQANMKFGGKGPLEIFEILAAKGFIKDPNCENCPQKSLYDAVKAVLPYYGIGKGKLWSYIMSECSKRLASSDFSLDKFEENPYYLFPLVMRKEVSKSQYIDSICLKMIDLSEDSLDKKKRFSIEEIFELSCVVLKKSGDIDKDFDEKSVEKKCYELLQNLREQRKKILEYLEKNPKSKIEFVLEVVFKDIGISGFWYPYFYQEVKGLLN